MREKRSQEEKGDGKVGKKRDGVRRGGTDDLLILSFKPASQIIRSRLLV